MPDFSSIGASNFEAAGAVTASSRGTTVTASASANTKGAYVELIASTVYPAAWVVVAITKASALGRFLVDIAVGAAASERVVIPNLGYQCQGTAHLDTPTYMIPVLIPAGSRVSARCQCSGSPSRTVAVNVSLISATMMSSSSFGVVTDFGTATGDSGLTSIDPGGTANTKGAYSQLSSSTPYPTKWINIYTGGDATGSFTAATEWLIDIAVGGAGSEQVVIPNLYNAGSTTGDEPSGVVWSLPVSIPAGSRIAARCQCSVNTATERLLDIAVWGAS